MKISARIVLAAASSLITAAHAIDIEWCPENISDSNCVTEKDVKIFEDQASFDNMPICHIIPDSKRLADADSSVQILGTAGPMDVCTVAYFDNSCKKAQKVVSDGGAKTELVYIDTKYNMPHSQTTWRAYKIWKVTNERPCSGGHKP